MPIVELRMPDDEKEGTEASLGTWFKAAGDSVSEHEPLVEINTDKVTIEIAAPSTGTIRKLYKEAGDVVLPGELLGTIDTGGTNAAAVAAVVDVAATPASKPEVAASAKDTGAGYSPAVRKLLAELNLDPQSIPKAGRGGRITPDDVGAYIKPGSGSPSVLTHDELPAGKDSSRLVPHTPMRKSIAKHMVQSVQAAPHVTSFFEADMYNVIADREARKHTSVDGSAPSVTAYLIHAALQAIRLVPEVNSKWHDAYLEVFDHVNFGVGTSLENGGLVVPVIRGADSMNLPALSQSLRDITKKARDGRLSQTDMEGGTFTLSNHGVGGSLFAAPIILPHGQAAILGTGKVQKRVIVCETGGRELFRVRPMMYVTLTVDHRVLDGQQTNGFLTEFVKALETQS